MILNITLDGMVPIPAGFHLTSVQNRLIDEIDCGHGKSAWSERVAQIWVDEQPGDELTIDKFESLAGPIEDLVFELDVFPDLMDNMVLSRWYVGDFDRATGELNLVAARSECKALNRGEGCGPSACC